MHCFMNIFGRYTYFGMICLADSFLEDGWDGYDIVGGYLVDEG